MEKPGGTERKNISDRLGRSTDWQSGSVIGLAKINTKLNSLSKHQLDGFFTRVVAVTVAICPGELKSRVKGGFGSSF